MDDLVQSLRVPNEYLWETILVGDYQLYILLFTAFIKHVLYLIYSFPDGEGCLLFFELVLLYFENVQNVLNKEH